MFQRVIAVILCTVYVACGSTIPLQRINDSGILSLPKQDEMVLLNFWATWCEPCIQETPVLIKLHQTLPELKMIGISLDAIENEGAVKQFVRKHGITYPIYLRQGGPFEATMNEFDPQWDGGLPATFIFRNGKQIYSHLGIIQGEVVLDVLNKSRM